MRVKKVPALALAGLLLLASQAGAQSPSVEVEALMEGAAVLTINGQRKMLRAGQSFDGVTLVAAGPENATLDIAGRQETVGLSRRISASFEEPSEQVVSIRRNANHQYQTGAVINGRSVRVLVDTGANIVAMSSAHARSLGIDYLAGPEGRVETAGGVKVAHTVKLRSVSVGSIRVDNVEATVVEGDFPATVLLGMSYLRHVDLRESNGILTLSRTP